MLLEDYFHFLAPNDIRLKGTRVGIETILYDFTYRSRSPEQIANTYPTITLEQVYATILYYHHKPQEVEAYLAEWFEYWTKMLLRFCEQYYIRNALIMNISINQLIMKIKKINR